MILDDNLVLFDSVPMSGSGAVDSGTAVCLNAFQAAGLQDPIPVCVRGGKIAGSGGITVQFQESEVADSGFSAVGPSWTVPVSSLQTGRPVGPRYIPREVSKPWVKLAVTRTSAFTSGTLFAAVVREEDQRYTSAQQIEA